MSVSLESLGISRLNYHESGIEVKELDLPPPIYSISEQVHWSEKQQRRWWPQCRWFGSNIMPAKRMSDINIMHTIRTSRRVWSRGMTIMRAIIRVSMIIRMDIIYRLKPHHSLPTPPITTWDANLLSSIPKWLFKCLLLCTNPPFPIDNDNCSFILDLSRYRLHFYLKDNSQI